MTRVITRNGVSRKDVPKQEFGNEGARDVPKQEFGNEV
jgi:hypothetical protein